MGYKPWDAHGIMIPPDRFPSGSSGRDLASWHLVFPKQFDWDMNSPFYTRLSFSDFVLLFLLLHLPIIVELC